MNAPHANHPTPADLAAFAVGKLAEADARAVAEHLAACLDCRRAAEEASGDSFLARVKAAGAPGPSDDTAVPGRPGPAAAPPALPPELANHSRYRVVRELGRGGMGVVYQARQTVLNREVVIKVISKALLDHPDAVERFRREAQAAAQLSHPNVVAVYDAEQAGDLHMLVMEFVPGLSLGDVLKRKGPLPVAHSCHYARQAALGLQHAHERGMVHRDIKPQNLMLTPKGQVKVLDFGLAKVVSERGAGKGLTSTGAYMGTPDYSAPEQATDARTADIRADIYSLGCTLYCLLTGKPPFEEDTAVKTILAHIEKQPQPLPELRADVPPELWQVVARLLAKDPAQRFQTPAEAAQALAPFIKPGQRAAGQGTQVLSNVSRPPSSAKGRPSQPPGRQPPAPDTEATPFEGLGEAAPRPSRKGRRRPRWPLVAAAAAGLLGLVLLAGVVFRLRTQGGVVLLENLPADAEVFVDGNKVEITAPDRKEPVRVEVPAGRHQLKVTAGATEVAGEQVTVNWGKAEPLKITLQPKPAGGAPPAPPEKVAGKVAAYVFGPAPWRLEGDELVWDNENDDGGLLFGDPSWTDYEVTVEARRTGGNNLFHLVFRCEDLLNYWLFTLSARDNDRCVSITTVVDGTPKSLDKHGWAVDTEWHKLRVKVEGEHIQCFLDEDPVFDLNDSRHPRGQLCLAMTKSNAYRFRNLKVTDLGGRVLVDGVHGLDLVGEQRDVPVKDEARAGTVWKGAFRLNEKGRDVKRSDVTVKVRKREGMKWEGELWAADAARGLKIEGTIDPRGNLTFRPTEVLAGEWHPDILNSRARGTIKGKQIHSYLFLPPDLFSEINLTREE